MVLKVVKIIILNILSQYLRGACVKSVSFTIVFGLIETKQILRGDYPEVDINNLNISLTTKRTKKAEFSKFTSSSDEGQPSSLVSSVPDH